MRSSDKHVLLVCPNTITASHLKVSIKIWGYRVVQVDEIVDAEKILSGIRYDLVLLLPPREPKEHASFSAGALRIDLLQTARKDQTRVFDSMKMLPNWMPQGVSRITGEVMNAELLRHGIRLALARKRGPQKRSMEITEAA